MRVYDWDPIRAEHYGQRPHRVGSFSPYVMAGRSPLEFGSAGIGTLLGAFAGTWLISRWSNGRQTFDTPAGIAKFAIISFAPTAVIRKSPAVFENIPVFRRLRPETWFERHCPARAVIVGTGL